MAVDGDADIEFAIDGHPMSANVSASPDIDVLLLGSDWLIHNSCQWDFVGGTVRVGERTLQTHKKVSVGACRKVLVADQHVLLEADTYFSSAEPVTLA